MGAEYSMPKLPLALLVGMLDAHEECRPHEL